jgi:hypothetical protein
MTVSGQNFEMYVGDSKEIYITVTDEETGLPLNLSPYVANSGIAWVVYRPTTKEIVLSKLFGAGVEAVIPYSNGVIKITLNPSDTENIIPNTYNHECEISSSLTNVATVTVGTIKFLYSRA